MKISVTNFNSAKKLDSQMRFFKQAHVFIFHASLPYMGK